MRSLAKSYRASILGIAFLLPCVVQALPAIDEYGNACTEVDGYVWYYRLNDDGDAVSIMRTDNLGNPCPAVSPHPTGAVTIPETLCGYPVVNIGPHAFNFGSDSGMTDLTIPSGVTNIGVCAFAWCSSLTNLTIGPSVVSIGDSAFQNCSGLVSVDIPDSVESLGENAFWACTSLSRVKLSLGMTSLVSDTFQQCTSLTCVTMPPSVTAISVDAFSGVTLGDLTIRVLPGLVDAVKAVF